MKKKLSSIFRQLIQLCELSVLLLGLQNCTDFERQKTNSTPMVASNNFRSWDGSSSQLYHLVGSALGSSWTVRSNDGSGIMTYGPYMTDIPAGVNTAIFTLEIDNNSADNAPVAVLDVYDATNKKVLAKRLIRRGDFTNTMQKQQFDVVFNSQAGVKLEFRVQVFGVTYLQHDGTEVRWDRLGLTSLWNNQSHFEQTKEDRFSYKGMWDGNTSSLVSLDGVWYAFNRRPINGTPGCSFKQQTSVVVRSSVNQGQTWSDPVVIVAPGNSAADACMVVDGSAFFDAETDTWQMLYQCLGNDRKMNMCHYTRKGRSPIGSFTSHSGNPSVVGGELWKQICGPGKSCASTTVDEGTPQIFMKKNKYYYVTFHGYDGRHGVRGVARTRDFARFNWEVKGADLPGDAMFSSKDCNKWHFNWQPGKNDDGCIGFGSGSLLISDGYYYSLNEAADLNLACTKRQHWVFGLMRSPSNGNGLAVSGNWESLPTNPFLQNMYTSPVGCALQYATLLRDRGELFLNIGFFSPEVHFPNQIYKLVEGAATENIQSRRAIRFSTEH